MGLGTTMLLGFIAGVTILLGLPLGRLRRPAPSLRAFLNAVAVGILLFLVWDVLSAAWEPIDRALGDVHDGHGGAGAATGYGLIFAAGLSVGLLGLVAYERWMSRRASAGAATGSVVRLGPGSMQVGELPARRLRGVATWPAARRLALMIAVGIGLHNFGEGLAIGGSAASGEIGLATVLVIGFALHNGTEGFGIVAPLAAEKDRPSWGFLLLMGLIGGGPTFVGTAVGRQFTSDAMSVIFLTLAAGSILYVVIQLLGVAYKNGQKDLIYWGVLLGLSAGFVTDMVVTAGGA